MKKKDAIKSNTLIDATSLILNVFIGIFFVPYYLTFFSAELYGFWISTSGIIVLLDIFDLGINTLFIEKLSSNINSKDTDLFAKYFLVGFTFYAVISLFIILFGILLSKLIPFLFDLNNYEIVIVQCFYIAVLTCSVRLFNSMFRSYGQSILKPKHYSLNIIYGLILGVLCILFFLESGKGILGLAYGYLFQQIFTLIFNLIISYNVIKSYVSLKNFDISVRNEFYFGIKSIFFSRISETMVKNVEPVIIGSTLGGTQSVIYVFTKKISDVIYQFCNIIIGSSFSSLVIIQEDEKKSKLMKVKNLEDFIFYLSVILLGGYISINKSFIDVWVGEEFEQNIALTISFCISTLMMIFLNYFIVYNFSQTNYKTTSIITFIESIIRLILLIISFKYIGLIGGPLSISITILISLFILNEYKIVSIYKILYLSIIILIGYFIDKTSFNISSFYTLIIKCFIYIILIAPIIFIQKKYSKSFRHLIKYLLK